MTLEDDSSAAMDMLMILKITAAVADVVDLPPMRSCLETAGTADCGFSVSHCCTSCTPSTHCPRFAAMCRLTSSNVRTGLDRPAMGYRFLIKMNPSSSLPMMLSFQPSKPHTYNFPAPFMVDSGLGGAVVSHNPQGAGAPTRANASLAGGAARGGRRAPAGAGSFGGGLDDDDDCGLDNADLPPPKLPEGEQQLNVPVRAVGVQPQLVLSKTLVEFGSRIVIRSHQRSMPYTQALYVRNNTEAPLEVGGWAG